MAANSEGASERLALSPIEPNAVLLHIGVHKTGTTALQDALASERTDLAEHGVLYPGPRAAAHWPALAVTSGTKPIAQWDRLVGDVAAWPGRVVISSEGFCVANDATAQRIVSELAGDEQRPVHILLGVRPLSELLASSWQQSLKSGITRPFRKWLELVLAHPEDPSQAFWARNDFGRQVERWSGLVGVERMTVVVADVRQPTALAETVEQLLDVPAGLVSRALPEGRSNRSFTAPEAELVRRVNQALEGRADQSVRRQRVQYAAVLEMQREAADPESARIAAPIRAQEQVAALGSRYAEQIAASGVVVVGDLQRLGKASGPPGHGKRPTSVPMDAAVAAVLGAALGAHVYEAEAAGEPAQGVPPRERSAGGATGESPATPPSALSDSRLTVRQRVKGAAGAAVQAWRHGAAR